MSQFPVLIHELIAVELWKAKVLPEVRNDAIESLLYFVVIILLNYLIVGVPRNGYFKYP